MTRNRICIMVLSVTALILTVAGLLVSGARAQESPLPAKAHREPQADPPAPQPRRQPPRSDGGTESGTEGEAEPQARDTEGAALVARATRGVVGSKHDFSMASGRAGDACRACHVPHLLAVQPRTGDPGEPLLEFYRIGNQREVFQTDKYTPGPTSLMCMSCHNGTVASSVLGSAHAILAGVREGFAVSEGWAARDHPIGVEYPKASAGYHPRAAVEADGRIPLPDGRVECTSCHDPHNRSGVDKMLVMSNRRSALCLACHNN